MKKSLIVFVSLLLFSVGAKAQFNSFPDSIAFWREYTHNIQSQSEMYYVETNYLMYGDTIINNEKCKNLYELSYVIKQFDDIAKLDKVSALHNNQSNKLDNKIGVLRKDKGKLYFRLLKKEAYIHSAALRHLDTTQEYLLHDFEWTVGDTLFPVNYKTGDTTFLIFTKDTIRYLGNTPYRTLLLSNNTLTTPDVENMLIEGLGFSKSIFYRIKYSNLLPTAPSPHFKGSYGVHEFCSEKRNYNFFGTFSINEWNNNCLSQLQWALTTPETYSKEMKIYPNPTKDYLFIDNLPQKSTISVLDITLKEEASFVVNEEQSNIDVSVLPQGVYFLKILSNNNIYTQKIIKTE